MTTIEQAERQAAERKRTHNPLAFPYYHPDLGGAAGMTMRDYFAAKAMQALIIANGPAPQGGWPTYAERTAYLVADAMIKAREA
jgi:hypothetical protein